MIKSLKTLVISLAILIFLLIIIVLITLYSRFTSQSGTDVSQTQIKTKLVDNNYDIISFEVEKNILYLHLNSNEKQILRIINLKDLNNIRDVYLK